MSDDLYTRLRRFETPDPEIGPRVQAPMLAQEQAMARLQATGHQFSWLQVLLPPLCFGPMVPPGALLLGLFLYQALWDSGLDLDRILGESLGWLLLAMVLFTALWGLRNYLRDKHDPLKLYWQFVPERGVVELEQHTLVSGISLWSNDFDPDCNTIVQWSNGKLRSVQDSGVLQWILAKTAAGHWLVLKEQYPGNFCYGPVGRMPEAGKQLQPCQQLTMVFAPGTQLSLGRRFDGAPISLVSTAYWMTADERIRLAEAAHHWIFFPPDRYGVVNDQDAGWVQRLADKAQASVGPQPAR